MTSPDHYPAQQPANPGVEGNNIIKALAGGFLNGGAVFNHIVGLVGEALAGSFLGQDSPLGEISDGQTALVNQLDLLNGVRGYCSAYQSVNINGTWNFGTNVRTIPFTEPLGPNKGAHIDESVPGIVLESKGLWLVHAAVHARATKYDGDPYASLFVDVLRPDGSLYSPMIIDTCVFDSITSITATFPVVVPGDGYSVRVKVGSGKWRWWDGGPQWSRLSVLKVDNRTDNPPGGAVPDETEGDANDDVNGQTLDDQGKTAHVMSLRTTTTTENGVTTYSDDHDSEENQS